MIKLTVRYGHPTEVETFESYYSNTHLPIATKMTGHTNLELTKFLNGPDGSKPDYHRMAEFWYASPEALQASMGSPEGQATAGDLANFATGGVKLLVEIVEN